MLLHNGGNIAAMEQFKVLQQVIKTRRTVKPGQMNGKVINNELMNHMLELANWAPNHGSTEPWRFIVFGPATKSRFCEDHASLYKAHTEESKFNEVTFQNLRKMGDNASHIVIAYASRGELPKIPFFEEIVATACAIDNLLLAANALGVAAYWGTGGMVLNPAFKEYLALSDENTAVLGALYFGYTDAEIKEGSRKTPISSKIEWR